MVIKTLTRQVIELIENADMPDRMKEILHLRLESNSSEEIGKNFRLTKNRVNDIIPHAIEHVKMRQLSIKYKTIKILNEALLESHPEYLDIRGHILRRAAKDNKFILELNIPDIYNKPAFLEQTDKFSEIVFGRNIFSFNFVPPTNV